MPRAFIGLLGLGILPNEGLDCLGQPSLRAILLTALGLLGLSLLLLNYLEDHGLKFVEVVVRLLSFAFRSKLHLCFASNHLLGEQLH